MEHPPVNPLLYGRVLGAGMAPHATVMSPGVEIAGNSAGFTVIILETGLSTLPQASVAIHVSVTLPPQAPGITVKVEALEVPESRQPPLNPLVKLMVLGEGTAPQSTVIEPGAIMVGSVAGLTIIVLETGASALPQASVAVHVSVTLPPQTPGVFVNVDRLEIPEIRQSPLSPLL